MGGNMSWPRFRGRNGLNLRPNYFSGDPSAPPPESGMPFFGSRDTDAYRQQQYMSGEIDRMVYGWWRCAPFLAAAARHAGITEEQVRLVQEAMLTWDFFSSEMHQPEQHFQHWGQMP